jgi:hypothetical protein
VELRAPTTSNRPERRSVSGSTRGEASIIAIPIGS